MFERYCVLAMMCSVHNEKVEIPICRLVITTSMCFCVVQLGKTEETWLTAELLQSPRKKKDKI